MNKLEKRMYVFVPYNISPIQQAIQAGHAVEQYAYLHGRNEEYIDYVKNWKTWIILNGGTTNSNRALGTGESEGSLNQITDSLEDNGIIHAVFNEPDLNNALTAVCFLADERVFNYKDYPDWNGSKWWNKNTKVEPFYSKWVKKLGGDKNLFLRDLLKYKKLA